MHPVDFSAFNCLLDSQCSLLTSQLLGSCSKLKWLNRAYAVYWLRGTLLYPCIVGKMVVDNLTNTSGLNYAVLMHPNASGHTGYFKPWFGAIILLFYYSFWRRGYPRPPWIFWIGRDPPPKVSIEKSWRVLTLKFATFHQNGGFGDNSRP